MGTQLLPAPAGEPQPIHLNDGTMLVPLARVDDTGRQLPLTAGGSIAGTGARPTAPTAPAAEPSTHAVLQPTTNVTPPTAPASTTTYAMSEQALQAVTAALQPYLTGSGQADRTDGADGRGRRDPDYNTGPSSNERGFLYRGNYYKKYKESRAAGTFDFNDKAKLEERIIEATLLKVQDEHIDGFGINDVQVRRVDPRLDADLLRVHPNAYLVVNVSGTASDGSVHAFPSVVDRDAGVYVDPRIGRG